MAVTVREPARRLYGRKRGRKLRSGQRARYETDLPGLRVLLPPAPAKLDFAALFGAAPADVWLEIGFGAGEHLAFQAAHNPGTGFIGCEPFLNGIVGLLARLRDQRLANVRIYDDDARLLLGALPEASIGRCFILFPDPWPKSRHYKRRIIQPQVLALLGAALKDGAELRVASDDASYVRWTLAHVLKSGMFSWLARRAADWRERPADWPETRYEAKARRAGKTCYFLRFARAPRKGAKGGDFPAKTLAES